MAVASYITVDFVVYYEDKRVNGAATAMAYEM